ncbi:MAG TPA: hypothetical protein DET40_13300 [Lentisphaeria bacterium]|nr:MAG: hypothetical protein A2X45_01385 [Lentisphaerae bacterium GWF2_50_93]HCE44517.1 hypothetical protein [Lentisphaeria bacterium]
MRVQKMFLLIFVMMAASCVSYSDEAQLFMPGEKKLSWGFGNGPEFKGATGKVSVDETASKEGKPALRLDADFTAGGGYVQTSRKIPAELDVKNLSFMLKFPGNEILKIRLIDNADTCHQIEFKIRKTDDWQLVNFPIDDFFTKMGTPEALDIIAKYQAWGKEKDKSIKWKGPLKDVIFLLTKSALPTDKPVGSLWLSEVKAEGVKAVLVEKGAFMEDFENSANFAKKWEVKGAGAGTLSKNSPYKGASCLHFERGVDKGNEECSVTSALFEAKEGECEVSGAVRSALESPDNSYQGAIFVEFMNNSGKVLEKKEALIQTGSSPWTTFKKTLQAPADTDKARMNISLRKTWGSMDIDELAFTSSGKSVPKTIESVKISSDAPGNLFLPEARVIFHVVVEAVKLLGEKEEIAICTVKDYWGSELGASVSLKFNKESMKDKKFVYKADLDLGSLNPEIGKYYELHVRFPLDTGVEYKEFSGFARLPEAVTKKYKPEEIPFLSRNWDNRVKEYYTLSDRLGIRLIGLWGNWNAEPPYKPVANNAELCQQLGAKWVVMSRACNVERGKLEYTDKSLREGMKEFLESFADKGIGYVCIGNEPHGGIEQVKLNVAAYKAIYEAIKAFDKDIPAISTAVEPNENYFKEGYQNYLDIYDFHVYGSYETIRKTIREYKELMKKYNAVKPIYSTEIGLNSQGMPRLAVASDLVKKVASFFAEGGGKISWFGINYPDPKGGARGTFGDAHNVFDCKYSLYNPKLDAIAYYNMVNAICVKKFAQEKKYDGDVFAFLFKDDDNNCLQVLWKDKDRADIMLPLPGVASAKIIYIDGSSSELVPENSGITVTVSHETVLLLYKQDKPALADKLGAPSLSLASPASTIVKGGSATLALKLEKIAADSLKAEVPASWAAKFADASGSTVNCVLGAPRDTEAREGRIILSSGKSVEITVPVKISSRVSATVSPMPSKDKGNGIVSLSLRNNGSAKETVSWKMEVRSEFPMKDGKYDMGAVIASGAVLSSPSEGQETLEKGAEKKIDLVLGKIEPFTLYRIKTTLKDSEGNIIEQERLVSGFVPVRKTDKAPALDGKMDEGVWGRAESTKVIDKNNYCLFKKIDKSNEWDNPEDLSADVRFLWDDKNLYIGIKVTDDVMSFVNEDGAIWNQDGLQMMIDPYRDSDSKPGKYEYGAAIGKKGPQMWCYSVADQDIKLGEVKDMKFAIVADEKNSKVLNYEIAIPWSHLAPFKPGAGKDLGLSVMINEDDGSGRKSVMGFFGGVHLKQVDMTGDLILIEQ